VHHYHGDPAGPEIVRRGAAFPEKWTRPHRKATNNWWITGFLYQKTVDKTETYPYNLIHS
jgi:hypothetical protein